MIGTIARHEFRLLGRERLVLSAGLVLLAAAVYALSGGLGWHQARTDEATATATENAERLAELRASAAEGGGSIGGARTFVALPPGPLASFAVGLADLAPERAEISIWKRPDTLFGRYQLESPLSLLAGRFDLSFVVLYLLPLFILALSYNLLSSEREGGTLALVVMQPVSLHRLLAAKLLARLAIASVFLLLIAGAGALALSLTGGLAAQTLSRLAGWLLVAWLYAAFWLAVAALVASLTRRSETSAAALAAVWLAFVLVIPGLLSVGVQSLSPVPSRLTFVSEMRAASSEAAKESAELLAQFYHEHPELATNGQQGGFLPAYYASQRQVERHLNPLLEDYEARLARQQQLVGLGRFASPAVVAQEAFIELAGSSLERQSDFARQARALLAEWHATLGPKIFLGETLAPADYEGLPRFDYAEPAVSRPRLVAGVLGLLLPAIAALALAHRRLDRFEVTS